MKIKIPFIGSLLAGVMSWIVNQSILWCILHVLLGWVYVAYWIVAKTGFYQYLEGLTK
jgi:hypothetical protein